MRQLILNVRVVFSVRFFFYMYSSWKKIDEYVDAEYAHCIKVSFVTEHGDSLVWKTSLVAFSKRI